MFVNASEQLVQEDFLVFKYFWFGENEKSENRWTFYKKNDKFEQTRCAKTFSGKNRPAVHGLLFETCIGDSWMCVNSCPTTYPFDSDVRGSRLNENPQNTFERRSVSSNFIFYQVQKFWSRKKLQLIEGCYLASIWKYLIQRSIVEAMEIATSCKEMLNVLIDSPM